MDQGGIVSDLWIQGGLPGSTEFQTFFVTGAGVLFVTTSAGYVLRSTDQGATWVTLSSTATGLFSVRRHGCGDASGNVAIFRYGYVDISTDGGDTWTPRETPDSHGITSCAFSSAGVLWYQANGSVRYSTDLGASWNRSSAPQSGGGGVMYIGPTGWIFVSDAYHVQRSTDGGASWAVAFSTSDPYDGLDHIDISPSGYGCATSQAGTRILLTADFGLTWTVVDSYGVYGLTGSAMDPDGRFLFATRDGWNTNPTISGAEFASPAPARSFPSTPAQASVPSDAVSFGDGYNSSLLSDTFGNVYATLNYSGSPQIFRLSTTPPANQVSVGVGGVWKTGALFVGSGGVWKPGAAKVGGAGGWK